MERFLSRRVLYRRPPSAGKRCLSLCGNPSFRPIIRGFSRRPNGINPQDDQAITSVKACDLFRFNQAIQQLGFYIIIIAFVTLDTYSISLLLIMVS